MKEYSVLIGGRAGFGIDKAGSIIGRLLNRLGYRTYIYRDYPSLIRGGHTYSIIRASEERIACHKEKVDFILALNQDVVNLHKQMIKEGGIIIYDSDSVKPGDGTGAVKYLGIPLTGITKEEKASEIMRNTCIIGAFCRAAGISWDRLAAVFKSEMSKEIDLNLKVARRGYDTMKETVEIEPLKRDGLPCLTGNQAIAIGLIKGGLKTYLAYPMTPSSPILHYLAELAHDFNLKVIHPESEISVMLMALGFAYMGEKVAVGTSGGGFCLMNEGLSFSGMAELPVVIVMGQRPGPSTGLPTYSSQSELNFVLNAGQGEFPRFIVAPGDNEEAYFWSAQAVNMAWRFQVPSFILSDKDLGEGTFNFDIKAAGDIKEAAPSLWDRKAAYKRYLVTDSGISPLAFAPDKDAIIKANSYEHDEFGISTEEPALTVKMQDKRLRKEKYLLDELGKFKTVNIYGNMKSKTAILCWGSNKGVCIEAAQKYDLKVIQPVVLSPFPISEFKAALKETSRLICVENNATGQLARLVSCHGLDVDDKILKYDGRPFSLDELEERLSECAL